MGHYDSLEKRKEDNKRFEELKRELEKDKLFTPKKKSTNRFTIMLEIDVEEKITDYFLDNARLLKEKHNINSRNKLIAHILTNISDNMELVFKDIDRKDRKDA